MRVVVTGGAGFLGSHLCEALIARGDKVVCLDDLSTGHTDNIMHLIDRPYFEFFETDVSVEIKVDEPVDVVAHFASAASPPDYMRLPLETLAVGSRGTENGLRLASPTRPGSSWRPRAKCTEIQPFIPKSRITGET